MLARARSRLTYSNVVSTVCLFVVLGGTAAALDVVPFAKNAGKVDGLSASKKPKKNTLLALDRNKKFPSSVLPGGLTGPAGPQGAQGPKGDPGEAGAPCPPTNPACVGPQGAKGDKGDTGNVPAPEAPRIVPDAELTSGWATWATGYEVSYWKDAFGVVHLTGGVGGGTIATYSTPPAPVFKLPPGYAPAQIQYIPVLSTDNTDKLVPGYVEVCSAICGERAGEVAVFEGNNYYFGFDGVTFRAG